MYMAMYSLVYGDDHETNLHCPSAAGRRNPRTLEEHSVGTVGTLVLSEFFSVVTTRMRKPLSAQSALSELERHA
jgi:hypothetical protein